jgi:putative ABC transport system permease protein
VSSDPILDKIKSLQGVKIAEGWDYSSTSFAQENEHEVTHTYPDKGHGSFTMLALPVSTKLLNLAVVEGSWLHSASVHDVVLNQQARSMKPGVKIGDEVQLTVNGVLHKWRVVGFTQDVGSPATAYVSLDVFSLLSGTVGATKMIRIAYQERSKEYASRKNKEVETLLEREKISVSSTMPVWLLHNAIAAHMRVLVNSLLAMAVLMALVGTPGLTSAMSMNIMERTREIGVMRAIGATPRIIRNLVVWEGVLTGALSILPAFILSIALSAYLGRFIGHMAFRTPLSLTISVIALLIWIAIIIAGSYAATVLPARRAIKLSTREALAYE